MVFEFDSKGKLIIDGRVKVIPEVDKVLKLKNGEKILMYIALMYDMNSPYFDLLPDDRDRTLKKDIFGSDIPKELSSDVVKRCIEKIQHMVLTPELRFLERYKRRIEQALEVLDAKVINDKNINTFLKDSKHMKELLNLKQTIDDMIIRSKKEPTKKWGGYDVDEEFENP